VDIPPKKNNIYMAKLEKDLGIFSTFYYRKKISTFLIHQMQEIESMGHEVGYHYETLAKTNGNYEKAIELFKKELEEFRKYVNIETICMHGASYSKYNSQKLWEKYNFNEFGIIGEPYLSINYKKVKYFNDTGRSWDTHRNNFRDKVNFNIEIPSIETSDQLLKYIINNPGQYLIQTHPQRWGITPLQNWMFKQRDHATNNIKKILIKYWSK
jgi:hypothetical protein